MPELLNALHDERLRDLKGWGETSERNLARAIQRMQEVGGRMPLAVALDIAEDLVAQLAAATGQPSRLCGIAAEDARHGRRHRPAGRVRRGPGSVMDRSAPCRRGSRLAHGHTKSPC